MMDFKLIKLEITILSILNILLFFILNKTHESRPVVGLRGTPRRKLLSIDDRDVTNQNTADTIPDFTQI